MTQNESINLFVTEYGYESINIMKARIKDGYLSKTDLRCGYIDFLDFLSKMGDITEHQRMTWTCPSWMY